MKAGTPQSLNRNLKTANKEKQKAIKMPSKDTSFSALGSKLSQKGNSKADEQKERDNRLHQKAKHSITKSTKPTNVRVVLRCRPLNAREKGNNAAIALLTDTAKKAVDVHVAGKNGSVTKTFNFDQVYGGSASQEDVYESTVKPVVDEVLDGFNCTIFAYGQTGTGKTHTMEGNLDDGGKNTGMIPRAVKQIFKALEKSKEFSVKASYMELYNEELTDLLGKENKQLRIFEDATGKKGMMVHNLEEIMCANEEDVFKHVAQAQHRRISASTLLNKNSSRSHAIFTITLHTKEVTADGEDVIKTGKLNLVDLAGSECVGKSGAKDVRAKEAGKINQSLLTLGRVINALVEKTGYVPYRDSKLTRLLQESLGGRAKTCIIATVSPAQACLDETLSTLEYAHRAKNIRNRPQINQKVTQKAYMRELVHEISMLKKEIEALRSKNGVFLPPEKWEMIESELKAKTLRLEQSDLTLQAKQKEWDDLQAQLDQKGEALKTTQQTLEETEFIVEKQQQTEKELFSQAEEVKEKLEANLSDTEQLHKKIDRKKMVESTNEREAKSFLGECTDRMAGIEGQFDQFCSQQVDSYGALKVIMENFVQGCQKDISSLLQQSNDLKAVLDGKETGLKEAATAQRDTVLASAEGFKGDHTKALNETMGSITTTKDAFSQGLSDMQRKLLDQQAKVDALGELMQQVLASNTKEVTTFSTKSTASVHSLRSDIERFSKEMMAGLGFDAKALAGAVQQQNAETQDLANSVISLSKKDLDEMQHMVQKHSSASIQMNEQMQLNSTKTSTEQQMAIHEAKQVAEDNATELMKQYKEAMEQTKTMAEKRAAAAAARRSTALEESRRMLAQQEKLLEEARKMAERQAEELAAEEAVAEQEAAALIQTQSQLFEQAFQKANDNIKTLADKHEGQLRTAATTSQEHFVAAKALQDDNLKQTSTALAERQQGVEALVSANSEKQTKALQDKALAIKNTIASQEASATEHTTSLLTSTDALVDSFATHCSDVETGAEKASTQLTQAAKVVTEERAGLTQMAETFDSTMAPQYATLTQQCESHVEQTQLFTQSSTNMSEDYLRAQCKVVDTMSVVRNEAQTTSDALAKEMQNSSAKMLKRYASSSKDVLACMEDDRDALKELHAGIRMHFGEFVEQRLTTDVATGETPQRKCVAYPKSFARTDGMEVLREEFRGNLASLFEDEGAEPDAEAERESNEDDSALDKENEMPLVSENTKPLAVSKAKKSDAVSKIPSVNNALKPRTRRPKPSKTAMA